MVERMFRCPVCGAAPKVVGDVGPACECVVTCPNSGTPGHDGEQHVVAGGVAKAVASWNAMAREYGDAAEGKGSRADVVRVAERRLENMAHNAGKRSRALEAIYAVRDDIRKEIAEVMQKHGTRVAEAEDAVIAAAAKNDCDFGETEVAVMFESV